jgi:ankyrin repeat protein
VSGPAGDAESLELAGLEGLAKSAPDIILDPKTLEQAAEKGNSKVVAYLLAAGSRPYAGAALRIAAEKGYLEIVRQLTKGEAPVPAQVATAGIQAAIKFNRYTILEFLLQRGFKPGETSGPEVQGASALAYALLTDSPQSAEILLKHGAELDAISGEPDAGAKSDGTALQRVIAEGKFDAANWLLDKGAKPDIPSRVLGITPLYQAALQSSDGSLALMQRLLEAGADPNRRSGNREIGDSQQSDLQNASPLSIAVRSGFKTTEKVRLLLKHGADPTSDDRLIELLIANDPPESLECLKLLVDAGARPDDAWMKNTMERNRGEVRDFLVEKFTIPGFANEAEIHLVIDDPFGIRRSKIALRSGETAPPDLGAWLLANHQNSKWAYDSGGSLKYQWLIWRKGGDGVLVKQELDFSGSGSFPPLQWGDVVACRIFHPSGSGGASSRNELPPEVLTALRKRIVFPITFEIDGKSREILVRGDRAFFDPTKNEVPLEKLQYIVELLWQPGVYVTQPPMIHLTRKGWPDVRLSYGSKEAEKFQLQAGDRVKLEISDEVRTQIEAKRRDYVTLTMNGYPYAKSFGPNFGGKPVLGSIPTLIQALVDTQVPWHPDWMKLSASDNFDMTTLSKETGPFDHFSLLPHPDLSNIRIRRMQEDGAENVIVVNLAQIIAASTEPATAEEPRKLDVMLQLGDVIEVSLIKERVGEPWKGFSAQEEAFFAKALSGRVRVTDDQGIITVRDLLYQVPRFIETASGWIPVPPGSGITHLRGSWLSPNGWINLKRGDLQSDYQRSAEVFLRDGDIIQTASRNPNPQPRVVPPPTPQPSR